MTDMAWNEATQPLAMLRTAVEAAEVTIRRLHKERESWKDCATRTQDALDDAEGRIRYLEECVRVRDNWRYSPRYCPYCGEPVDGHITAGPQPHAPGCPTRTHPLDRE